MTLNIINDFINFLNNKFKGEIPNIIFFLIGLVLGIILFFVLSLLIIFIYKLKNKKKKNIVELNSNDEYKAVIQSNKDIYLNVYKKASINEKVSGIGKIMLNMMESISLIYYPDSSDPIFELSTEQLVDFLSYFTNRLNEIIDNLLDNRLKLVNKITKYSIKDKKISFIIELIDKSKQEKKENTGLIGKVKDSFLNLGKKIAVKIGSNIIDNEFLDIIDSLGEDINNLYRKKPMQVSVKESVGDSNV